MTKTLLAVLLTVATLTNKDVMDLVAAKLSADLLITTIRSSPTQFDTSVPALITLRKAGVPNEVILAMLTVATGAPGVPLPPSAGDVVRLDFPDVKYRFSKVRFAKGVLRAYDDRLVFTPHRPDYQEYALTIPWARVTSLCYEKGPFYGDVYFSLRDPVEQRILSTDPPEINGMKDAVSTFLKRPIPECE